MIVRPDPNRNRRNRNFLPRRNRNRNAFRFRSGIGFGPGSIKNAIQKSENKKSESSFLENNAALERQDFAHLLNKSGSGTKTGTGAGTGTAKNHYGSTRKVVMPAWIAESQNWELEQIKNVDIFQYIP